MVENGFALVWGKNLYWLKDEHEIKCDSIINKLINGVCNHMKFAPEVPEKALSDKGLRNEIRRATSRATYELHTTQNGYQYHHFVSIEKHNKWIQNFPLDNCSEIVFLGGDN